MIWHCPTYPPSLHTIFFFAPCTIATQIFFPSSHVSHSFLWWHLDTCCFSCWNSLLSTSYKPTLTLIHNSHFMWIFICPGNISPSYLSYFSKICSQYLSFMALITDIICYLFTSLISVGFVHQTASIVRVEGTYFYLFVSLTPLSPEPSAIPGIG